MKQIVSVIALVCLWAANAAASPDFWRHEWPKTDFSKHSVPFEEILSGGPPKDGIPPIDNPAFKPAGEIEALVATEPVIGLSINGAAKAYPLRILMRHEIVNDELGGVPISVTFCPLCNAAVVFDRRVGGKVLDFGTTGKLRNSDLVMWDRQTESWWQQFLGEAIVGTMTGTKLKALPARLESWENYRKRFPQGQVLAPTGTFASMDTYCCNPYGGYDSQPGPYPHFLTVNMPQGIPAMLRVISLEDKGEAWSMALLRKKKELELPNGVILRWTPGQNSALDTSEIARGRDVGNVTATRQGPDGPVDVPYFVDFAFADHAFFPDRTIHVRYAGHVR
ncbi:MAG: DUF3179 domain-containing protein [Rickettsiales bacterium]